MTPEDGGTGGRDISAYLCPLANVVCIICAGCPGCAPGAVRGPVLLLSIMLLDTLLVTVTTPATLISNHDTRNNAFHALHFRVALSSRYNYNIKKITSNGLNGFNPGLINLTHSTDIFFS